ncbi:hypothetical protein PL81_33110 [Streptomyces sp. RSD-27]|nr:hypothetical protein PL81_33110 [Streptomyces sp. RSD-27]
MPVGPAVAVTRPARRRGASAPGGEGAGWWSVPPGSSRGPGDPSVLAPAAAAQVQHAQAEHQDTGQDMGRAEVRTLPDPGATMVGDGGGLASAVRRVVEGSRDIAGYLALRPWTVPASPDRRPGTARSGGPGRYWPP